MERRLGEDGELQIISPAIQIETAEGLIELTWHNTVLKAFGDNVFNHIQHTNEVGEIVGIDGSQDLWSILFEAEYPLEFRPVPTEIDFDFRFKTWLHQLQSDFIE